jgi:hypothetical protein
LAIKYGPSRREELKESCFFLWDFCYFLFVRATRDGAPDTRNRYDNAEGEKMRGGSRKSKREEEKRRDGARREDERKIARRETRERQGRGRN